MSVSRLSTRQLAYIKELKKRYIRKLKKKPCIDCNKIYPHYVMQFDHLPHKGIKLFDIKSGGFQWDALYTEISKCELVCANCHLERTHQRRLCKSSSDALCEEDPIS